MRIQYLTVIFCAALIFAPCQSADAARPNVPAPSIDTNSTEYATWKAFVDAAVGGSPGYAFQYYEAALMARLAAERPELGLDEDAYANYAIAGVDAYVASAESTIAAGGRPKIAADSYLHIGPSIRNIASTYDWLYDRLTSEQRTRWSAFAEQAIWNVWNHQDAQWGGKPFSWSGWSRDNPGNNYFYSFLTATMFWGLASENQTWLDFLRTDRFPLLVNYFNDLPGGGSQEGTGYGVSHKGLFQVYREWLDATGEDFSARNSHARESIDYWVHATVPTLDRLAPIGDQSRDSSASLYDYHEHLMLEAVYLNRGTAEAERGTWWLNNNSVDGMYNGFNRIYALIRDANWKATAPTALLYHSPGTGHLFARSSWNPTATWLSFVCGPYVEAHAHQDQGAFSIYKDEWLAVTENIHTHSGLHGYISDAEGPSVHNIIRFAKNGTTIKQTYNSESAMTKSDDGDVVTINADVSNAYIGRADDVKSWTRDLTYTRSASTVRVHDRFTLGEGVTAEFQVNTPTKPFLVDGVIRAGNLEIVRIEPENAQVKILDWRTLGSAEYKDGWKVSLSGASSEYIVELRVINGGETVEPPSTPKIPKAPTILGID